MLECKESKSLRWLSNQFSPIKEPKDDTEKMCNCIHFYCLQGAELIEKLLADREEV